MGSFIRLAAKDLGGRIDAGYYRPDYVANAKRLLDSSVEHAALSSLVSGGRRTLYFGTSTLEEEQAPMDWVPFLTSDDLGDDGFFIDTRARRRVAPSFLNDYPAGRLRSGELLVKVKGPNQTTAYIETAPEYPVLVSGTIWGALVRKDIIDPHYLVAALSCPYAVMARTRLRTNLNVEFLGAEDLLSLALPKPAPLAQRYIGDKVRHAERLRELGRKIAASLRALETNIPIEKATVSAERTWKAPLVLFDPIRLDAKYYAPGFLHVAKAAASSPNFVSLNSLLDGIRYGASVEAEYVRPGKGLPFIRGTDLSPNRIRLSDCVDLHPRLRAEIGTNTLREGQILITRSGTVGIAAVVTKEAAAAGYGSFMMSMSLKSGPSPYFVSWYLNSWVGRNQVRRRENGAIQQNINIEELSSVAVWKAPDSFQCHIEHEVRRWQETLFFTECLILTAKLLVELLIEGQVTEAELVAAQKSLEAGDRSADRAILQALRHGDASDAKPLIPDSDGLYALLDQDDGAKDG